MGVADSAHIAISAARNEVRSPVGVSTGIVFAALVAALGVPDEKWRVVLGDTSDTIVGWSEAILLALLVVLLMIAMVRTGHAMVRAHYAVDPVAPLRAARFKCRILDTQEDAVLVNQTLVRQIFPDGSIEIGQSLLAQDKNPCRLVGLIDAEDDSVAGWSSLWPVTVAAGRDVERGIRLDDDLLVDDLLPQRRNADARYLILLSFGILPAYRNAAECPTRRLGRFVIEHIMETFVGDATGRSLKLVAIAYSPEGERLCRMLGMERNGCYATYAADRRKPILCADVTMTSLLRSLRRL